MSEYNNTQLRYDAIIFDMDGVLADTRDWVVHAYQHTSAVHALAVNDEQLLALFGQPLQVCYEILSPTGDNATLVETHRAFQRANMHLVLPFDGVPDMLAAIRSAGYRIGMVTGRTHHSAVDTLTRLGLLDYFAEIVGADDTERHKPDPMPLQYLLNLWGISPDRALMVGDAPADILCGQGAGCETAAALYGFVGPELLAYEPTYSLATPKDLLILLALTGNQ